jgi:hypothetical protein
MSSGLASSTSRRFASIGTCWHAASTGAAAAQVGPVEALVVERRHRLRGRVVRRDQGLRSAAITARIAAGSSPYST